MTIFIWLGEVSYSVSKYSNFGIFSSSSFGIGQIFLLNAYPGSESLTALFYWMILCISHKVLGQSWNKIGSHKISSVIRCIDMPKYVVISNHPPNTCPSANANVRKRGDTLQADLATFTEKHKIKVDVIYHLDPGHKVLWVLDAPSSRLSEIWSMTRALSSTTTLSSTWRRP